MVFPAVNMVEQPEPLVKSKPAYHPDPVDRVSEGYHTGAGE